MLILMTLDGEQLDPEQPAVRADDRGWMRGDGVFETILVVDGRPRELRPHLERLSRSAIMLGMPAPDLGAWEKCTLLVIAEWQGEREMIVKLLYSHGAEFGDGTPTALALGMPLPVHSARQRVSGLSAITLTRGFDPTVVTEAPWLLFGAKSVSYAVNMTALRHAASLGADDVIFVGADGSVLEAPLSTVVVARDHVLHTTPAGFGVLPGTTQAALFRAATNAGWTTRACSLRVADLHEADGVFLTSSARGVIRVHTLNGVALPDATALYDELTDLYEGQYR